MMPTAVLRSLASLARSISSLSLAPTISIRPLSATRAGTSSAILLKSAAAPSGTSFFYVVVRFCFSTSCYCLSTDGTSLSCFSFAARKPPPGVLSSLHSLMAFPRRKGSR